MSLLFWITFEIILLNCEQLNTFERFRELLNCNYKKGILTSARIDPMTMIIRPNWRWAHLLSQIRVEIPKMQAWLNYLFTQHDQPKITWGRGRASTTPLFLPIFSDFCSPFTSHWASQFHGAELIRWLTCVQNSFITSWVELGRNARWLFEGISFNYGGSSHHNPRVNTKNITIEYREQINNSSNKKNYYTG